MAGQTEKTAQGQPTAVAVADLDSLLESMPATTDKTQGKALVDNLLEAVQKDMVSWDSSLVKTINRCVQEIDQKLSEQLSEILHHEDFQKLEGSWRGLKYLVHQTNTGKDIKIKLLNATKQELSRDFSRSAEFDQSYLWKQIYENSYGQAGEDPYGLLVGDFEFNNDNMDMELLTNLAGVSAAAFSPFISATAPEMFGLTDWEQMGQVRDLASYFSANKTKYIKWNSFRDSDDSRFVTLTLPRVLAREPYGTANTRIEEFQYEEFPLSKDGRFSEAVGHNQYTWMNSSYAYAACITRAFEETGWCTKIRGYENGGMVDGLPTHVFRSKEGEHLQKCPSEVLIPDRREKEFSDLGFLPLVNWKNTDKSVFIGAQTTQKPKTYHDPQATENAQISSRLPYIMASSRIAHFLKVIAREKIGSFMEQPELQDFLSEWISGYVMNMESATAEQKAQYPLREAKIIVEKIPGKSGAYNARVDLRPWLQLEELHASVSMVAEIPADS